MTGKHLISIPRVQSSAPNKNTIEWEIAGKVSVGFMLVDRLKYFVFMKIRVEKNIGGIVLGKLTRQNLMTPLKP